MDWKQIQQNFRISVESVAVTDIFFLTNQYPFQAIRPHTDQ